MTSTDASNFLIAEAQLVLDEARRVKSEKIKHLGSPIQLSGKALAIQLRGSHAWIAENTAVARKLDLESGKTLQLYKGHTGPVTTLAFCDRVPGSGDAKILITGSWDETIKLWDTDTKEIISSTHAHTDFVKGLFVLPTLDLLISGSSDKIVRFWDLSTPTQTTPLRSVGSISSHTRPVECLDGRALSATTAVLYTGDTMGVIKVWNLAKNSEGVWRSTLREELTHHRTRINEILYGNGQLWTASSDETVQVVAEASDTSSNDTSSNAYKLPPITHPVAVRTVLPLSLTDLDEPYLLTGAGDIIRVYDVSSPDEPELISQVDAHWHDVTAIRLWIRKTVGEDQKIRVEPWIITASLDSTIRKWRLSELLDPTTAPPIVDLQMAEPQPVAAPTDKSGFQMTAEEERELDELLDSDSD